MGIPITWEAFETYLLYESHRKPETLPTCRRVFIRLKNYFEDKELNKQAVYSFFDYIRSKGDKNSTINNYIKYLHHIGRILGSDDLIKLKYLPEDEQIWDTLTPSEINRMLTLQPPRARYIDRLNHFWPIVIETLLATGMRRQELCNLTWDDFREDTLIVRVSKNKTGRICKITKELSDKIKTLQGHKYIFGTDTKLCAWLINRELQLRARLLNINKHITAHTLRRTSATEAASHGINLAYIQRFLGHKSVSTTSKYIQVDDAALQAVSKSLTVNQGSINIDDVARRLQQVAAEFIPNFTVDLIKTKVGVRLTIKSFLVLFGIFSVGRLSSYSALLSVLLPLSL